MYNQSPPMSDHHRAAEDDPNSAPAGGDSLDHQIAYEEGASLDHHVTYDEAAGIIVDGDSNVYLSAESELAMPLGDVSNQLTLTFRGQVYVFDSVTPDKVQAVFLLLGGCEFPASGLEELEAATHNQKSAVELPGRSSTPQRAASLNRFRQKRKERCYDKKVRYGVRQEVALRMQRSKGQFTSSKKPDNGVEEVTQEALCTHCGKDSKSTPMMRRGPSGPRSLCNACGLFWANRGTLRDLSKKGPDHLRTPNEQGEAEANDSDSGTAVPSDSDFVGYTGDESALIAENGAASGVSPANGYHGGS